MASAALKPNKSSTDPRCFIIVTAWLVWIQQCFLYLGSANQPSHCESAGWLRGRSSSLAMAQCPKDSLALLRPEKATDCSHSGLGFMVCCQLSQSSCGMPSTKSIQTHHFDLSVLKMIQLCLRSFTLAQVSAVVPSTNIKLHPQHGPYHVLCKIQQQCQHTHMQKSELNMLVWWGTSLLSSCSTGEFWGSRCHHWL